MATPRAIGVRRLNTLLQRANASLFVLDESARLVYVNRAWIALTGRSLEAVQGLVCSLAASGEDGELLELRRSLAPPPEVFDGLRAVGPVAIPRPEGGVAQKRLEFLPLEDGRRVVAVLGMIRDPEPEAAGSSRSKSIDNMTLQLRTTLAEARRLVEIRQGEEALIGIGPAHRRLLNQVELAAQGRLPVLIVGESGTGKRIVARAIHRRGPHSDGPLVPIDAGLLDPEAVRTALEPGGESGGTSLLIELDHWPVDLQETVAEAIESGRLRPTAVMEVDPETALRAGSLRPRLFYGLTGLVIRLAPLRDRLDQIPVLAQLALEQSNRAGIARREAIAPAALEVLRGYDWPGNVAELFRVLAEAHRVAEGPTILATDLPAAIQGDLAGSYIPSPAPPTAVPLDQTLEAVERRLIEEALRMARQNKSKAAEILAISRPRLYRRVVDLGLEPRD